MATSGAWDPSSLFATVTTFITGTLLPVVVGLVVLGISVRLGIKAVRKYSKSIA